MRTSAHIALASVIATGGIVAAVAVVKRYAIKAPAAARQVVRAETPEVTPALAAGPIVQVKQDVPPVAVGEPTPTMWPAEAESPKLMAAAKPAKQPGRESAASASAVPPAPKSKPTLAAPVARVALSFVGADADAEAVWLDAINDPTVPPNERKDLIEDLNEDGFADPKNITADDLPLVMSRLQLIESIAADSMDETNLTAFAEAYKDLVNMLDRATRQ
jgi:hypothetical protein